MGFQGVSKENFQGNFEKYFKGSSAGCLRVTWSGTQKETCRQAQVQVRSGPGLFQVRFESGPAQAGLVYSLNLIL